MHLPRAPTRFLASVLFLVLFALFSTHLFATTTATAVQEEISFSLITVQDITAQQNLDQPDQTASILEADITMVVTAFMEDPVLNTTITITAITTTDIGLLSSEKQIAQDSEFLSGLQVLDTHPLFDNDYSMAHMCHTLVSGSVYSGLLGTQQYSYYNTSVNSWAAESVVNYLNSSKAESTENTEPKSGNMEETAKLKETAPCVLKYPISALYDLNSS